MNILGLFGPGPNPSACLLKDGEVIAWVEEERLNRIKTAPNSIPILSARTCLEMADLNLDEVDGIAYGWDCKRFSKEASGFFKEQRIKYPGSNRMGVLQEDLIINSYHPHRIERALQIGLSPL